MIQDLTPAQHKIGADKHRFKVLVCGRRFGKTTLAVEEIKGKIAAGKKKIAYIAPCYDEQTEILTDGGWKLFKELKVEKVATYKNGELVFEKPQNYFVYDYDGEMVGIDNNAIDMLTTPHHRCLVKNHRKGDWVIKKAEEIEKTWTYRFKKTTEWKGESYPKTWARFWGWYVSEGYSRKRNKGGYEITITQQKKEFFDDIRKTLSDCGLKFHEDKRSNGINFRISGNKELTEKCLLLGKSDKKYVFDEILKADSSTIKEFLEAYWNGDGHYPKSSYDYKRAETKSELLANQLQELIIKIGGSATMRKINSRDLYSVSWLHNKFNEPLIRKGDYYRTNYKGKVYCVEVSSGIVMVRRNGKHYWCGNTYQQARDIAWEILKKELQGADFNESRLEIRVLDCIVSLRGWESIETMRGQAFDFVVIDEVAMMRDFWSNWQEVIRPTLTDTKGKVIFVSTPKGFNHFYDLYNLESTDSDYKSFHFTTYDNPYIPKEEIDKARIELTEDRFAQEYLADFRKTEGLVYPEFSRERHLYDENQVVISRKETIAGVDFGYTHEAAIPSIDIDLENNYWITEEWYHSGKTEDEIAEYVANKQYQRVYPDPATPSAIERMRRMGVNIREVIKNKDSIKSGIQTIRELFKANRLKINKKCINLINELETYSYPEEDPKQKELPIKEHDHLCDSVRYALHTNEKARPQAAKIYVPQDFINATPHINTKKASVYIPKFHR